MTDFMPVMDVLLADEIVALVLRQDLADPLGGCSITLPRGRSTTTSRRQPTTSGRQTSSPKRISTSVMNHQPPGPPLGGSRPNGPINRLPTSSCVVPCSADGEAFSTISPAISS